MQQKWFYFILTLTFWHFHNLTDNILIKSFLNSHYLPQYQKVASLFLLSHEGPQRSVPCLPRIYLLKDTCFTIMSCTGGSLAALHPGSLILQKLDLIFFFSPFLPLSPIPFRLRHALFCRVLYQEKLQIYIK